MIVDKRTIQIRQREVESSKTLSEYFRSLEKLTTENNSFAEVEIFKNNEVLVEKFKFDKLELVDDTLALLLFKNSNVEIKELKEHRYQVFPNLKVEENVPDSYLWKIVVTIYL